MAGTGLPDVDSFARYGGPLQNSGPLDPWTESAEQRNLYVANVAAMTQTVARAMRSFIAPTAGQGTIYDATGLAHDAVWGAASGYKPAITGVTGGYGFDIFWPTQITDDFGNKRLLSLKRAYATVESTNGTLYLAQAHVMSNRKVRVFTFNAGVGLSTPRNIVGQTVTVWVR